MLKFKDLQKAWNVLNLIESELNHQLVIQNCDISISWLMIPALVVYVNKISMKSYIYVNKDLHKTSMYSQLVRDA